MNAAQAVGAGFVDGFGLASVISARIAFSHVISLGHGLPPWLGLGPVASSLLAIGLHRIYAQMYVLYWYCDLVRVPPMRMVGGTCMKTFRPGIRDTFGRSS